ncbi:MAG: tyrosinase family protein [Planctomycetota bacterium]
MDVRKNQRDFSPSEKASFVEALLKLKRDGNPRTGRNYDTYVKWHMDHAMTAHRQPQFLPWHRVFVRLLEIDLNDVSGGACPPVPYWDWTADQSPTDSLWGSDFLGGNGDASDDGRVKDGPFAHARGDWTLVHSSSGVDYLQRRFGELTGDLPGEREVRQCLGVTPYDVAPWGRTSDIYRSFRNRLEGWCCRSQLHNRVHVWVGGAMVEMTSPNDPVFFLHHCNVDRLWAAWQQMHPGEAYQTGAAAGANEVLAPFKKDDGSDYVVAETLDWTGMGFDYDVLPVPEADAMLAESASPDETNFFSW